ACSARDYSTDRDDARISSLVRLPMPSKRDQSVWPLASRLQDFPKQNGDVRPERVSVLAELEHVQLPLPGFDFADKGMGSIEASGQLALCNTGAFSCCLQRSYQCFVTRGAEVLAHRMSPNQGHQ